LESPALIQFILNFYSVENDIVRANAKRIIWNYLEMHF